MRRATHLVASGRRLVTLTGDSDKELHLMSMLATLAPALTECRKQLQRVRREI